MKNQPTNPAEIIRQKAEKLLINRIRRQENPLSENELLQLIHELEVHQIELEMQNNELIEANEKIEILSKKYTDLYDFAPTGNFTFLEDGTINELNLRAANLLNKERYHLKNKRFSFFLTTESKPLFYSFLELIFSTRTKQTCDIALSDHGDGKKFLRLSGITNEKGNHCYATALDESMRIMAESELRNSEQRFKNLFERHNSIMLLIDPESGNIIDANEAAVKYYGYSAEKFSAMNIKEINRTLSVKETEVEMQKALKEEKNFYIFTHRLADGSERIVEVHSSPIDFQGTKILFSIIHDITKRKQAEDDLEKSKRQYDELAARIPVGVYLLHSRQDGSFNLQYASPRFEQFFNISLNDILLDAKVIYQSIHPDDLTDFIQTNTDCIKQKISFDWKGRIISNGEIRWMHFTSSPQKIENQEVLWHGILADITERKKIEDEIKNKNSELQLSLAEKDKFFSIIAHDLRSPFNAFLGLAELLVEDFKSFTTEEVASIILSIRNSALNLYDLLANLLEWSKLQRGLTTFNPEPLHLTTVVAESMVQVKESAIKKKIEFTLNLGEDFLVMSDKYMLQSVLRNLASNAVKFTPKGGSINLTVRQTDTHMVEIAICDSGIGMDKLLIENLFRLDKNTNRAGTDGESSTGLGLIISKDFIEKQGGELRIESVEEKGTTFFFTVPLADNIS